MLNRVDRDRPFLWPGIGLILLIGASACSEAVTTPTLDPDQPAQAAVAGGPDAVASVRGGAHYRLKDPPAFVGDFKWIYGFSIEATARADGSADGKIRLNSKLPPGKNNAGLDLNWWAEIAVDCVEVEGDTAWMTGFIVEARTESPAGPGVGGYAMVIVRDGGPGGTDQINVGPPGAFGAEDCTDRPPIFPGAFVDGNVRVAGDT